jgi:hypothetical protein
MIFSFDFTISDLPEEFINYVIKQNMTLIFNIFEDVFAKEIEWDLDISLKRSTNEIIPFFIVEDILKKYDVDGILLFSHHNKEIVIKAQESLIKELKTKYPLLKIEE